MDDLNDAYATMVASKTPEELGALIEGMEEDDAARLALAWLRHLRTEVLA